MTTEFSQLGLISQLEQTVSDLGYITPTPIQSKIIPLMLDGHDVMTEFDLNPGPLVGELLEAIREAQATGKVNTREEVLVFARDWIKENA